MTIRFKLTTTAIAVILVANSLLSFITLQYLSQVWMREVQTRVKRNLNAARAAYGNHLDVIAALLRGTARDRTLGSAVKREDQAELEGMLHDLAGPGSMDFVALLDRAGKVTCRSGSKQRGDDLSADPLVAGALRDHKTVSGTVVLTRERLLAEGPDLAERASIKVLPTEAARPTADTLRTAYEPIKDPAGRIIGVLYVGLLQAPFSHQRNVISAVVLTLVVGATLASLVLLDVARETPQVKTHVDINDLVRQTMLLLGKRDAFQNITLVEDLSDQLPLVYGDKNQLQQVLVNLSLNACEAMPNGGTLLVSTAWAANQVVIEVVDTGCGIKKEHLDQVFEPFFTTKPVGKGTGLGLSVSYGIVHQHGGTLEVASQEGKGTTFTITLPSAPPAEV